MYDYMYNVHLHCVFVNVHVIGIVQKCMLILIFLQIAVPWFQIFTSPAMWAIIVAHFCNNWMNYTMLTCLPKYMKDVLQLGLNDKSDVSFMLVNYTVHKYIVF